MGLGHSVLHPERTTPGNSGRVWRSGRPGADSSPLRCKDAPFAGNPPKGLAASVSEAQS
jgi:hypothetical protein